MWSNVIAVVGTLLGGLLGGWVQAWQVRNKRREDRRTEALTAVVALLEAVANHRRARFLREESRLSGADAQVQQDTRDAAHATRGAITRPWALVDILTPALADAAEKAVQATYAMRDTANEEALQALRAASVASEKQLKQIASRVFGSKRCRGGV